MRPRILITEPGDFSPRALGLLREHAEVELRRVSHAELAVAFTEYDVVWQRLAHRVDAAVLGEKPRCRVLATAVTGLDHLDLEACRKVGVKVVSLKGETAFLKTVRATAELTVGLAMALMRHIPEAAQSVNHGHWRRDLFRGNELYGKTAGIVGVGRLGELVAGYLAAFGMTVIGFDPRRDFPAAVSRVDSLEELLRRSDLATIHVTLEPSTRKLIGVPELAAMKRGSWLVNTSRGEVIDEQALLAALSSGHVAGAALDVLTGEPDVDAHHPVVRFAQLHPSLLVVPHIGGNTFESFEKTEHFLAGRVLEALQ